MRYAIDPKTGKKVSAKEWDQNHPEESAKCPVCDEYMKVRANSALETTTHFWHKNGSKCPTVKNNSEKYNLQPVEKDYKNAKKIKKSLLNNLETVYQECKKIYGKKGFKRSDFKELIRKASENNTWFYKGLTMKYLPYVLLVNYGVFQKADHRKEKVYFVFDEKLSNYDDLWIKPGKMKQKIFKIYANRHNEVEEVKIDFDTSTLCPEYFLSYVTGFQGTQKEQDFLNW